MNIYKKNYHNLLLVISVFVCSFLNLSAQKNEKIWEELLQNNRKNALDLVSKIQNKDIEDIILERIVMMENGKMQNNSDFVASLPNYEGFENYMFATWRLPFMFEDYLDNGFNGTSCKKPNLINAEKVQNATVKNGLKYIQAISSRYQKQWDKYKSRINSINAITEWEYCGVFENLNSSGIDMPYEPEEEPSNKVIFDAQSKGNVSWYKPTKSTEVYNFFSNHSEFGTGVHYAQTFIDSEKNQRALIKLGKGQQTKVWLNDVLIHEDDSKYITELDAFTYEVNLKKGINRILLKCASSGSTPYYIVRLENLKEQPLSGYTATLDTRNYKKGTLEKINPKLIPHSIETYFQEKLKLANKDNYLNTFCLSYTYYRNGKIDEAIELIKKWSEKFPKSSFLKSVLIEYYSLKGEKTTSEKLSSNLKRQDPDYYLSLMIEFENSKKLLQLDIKSYEEQLEKIKNAADYSFMKSAIDFMIYFRRNDQTEMRKKLDELLLDENLPSKYKNSFSEFYSTIFNDDASTIDILEKYNKSEFNSGVISYLAFYYNKQNRKEDVIKLYDEVCSLFPDDNDFLYRLIQYLHENQQYERSLTYIEKGLVNFPNSFVFIKLKADALVQLDKKQEAIELYKVAISRRPSSHALRSKIKDLNNEERKLDEFVLKTPYQYIEKNRNKGIKNNYGIVALLNETSILGYKKGGGEYNTTSIYEITSQNGIDIFKEYNLGLSGSYVINKSEIIKANGEIVPADKNGSRLVFEGLAIGDVIYIDYQAKYSKYGRFYKDYVLTHNFKTYHPTIRKTYRFLSYDKNIKHKVTNGEVAYKSFKKDDLYVHEWEVLNSPGLTIQEDYMPNFNDITTKLHVSSIKSWNEIANWYSDLVRKQLKQDAIFENTFNEIFPKGYKQLTEDERARRIYNYITDNLNYSHVSFRQGGFIPQKPSKTISSKLGDCKDFSALFTSLARNAGLETNMVLILTSDYGKSNLVLPSTDFNHCIVTVNIDKEEYFLELTDKNLPYKSLPMSLRGATALKIPLKSNSQANSDLFHLENTKRQLSYFSSTSEIDLKKNTSDIKLTTSISGDIASFYIEMLTNKEGKLLDDAIHEEIEGRIIQPTKFIKLQNIKREKEQGAISYTTLLTSDIKINKISNLFTFNIPFFLNPYNNSIIQSDTRAYPIDYRTYENTDIYKEVVIIKLKENQEFLEAPENVSYKFKGQSFSTTYKLEKPNVLKIEINANTMSSTIMPEDYQDFKTYVAKVIDTKNVMIAFKEKK